ncbi:hypothetical protein BMI79_16935 [Serratia oryzae]|uniref:Adhesin n=1 Tax=Serratia oryzae TaxID=2034155 RepID=A0A1S8CGU0_9GAMM|nr:hypothetical protein BMI79_16935 [Serratia oryzae]
MSGLLLLLGLCASERSAQATLKLELLGNYPNITAVKITGDVNDMPLFYYPSLTTNGLYFSTLNTPIDPNGTSDAIQVNAYFGSVNKRYAFARYNFSGNCPTDAGGVRAKANQVLNGLTLPLSGTYDGGMGNNMVSLVYQCTTTLNHIKYSMSAVALTPGYDIEVINPPPAKSVCSLNGQNMSLDFSSASLNVNGLSQSQNLNVSCTTGTAKDYNLRLTGSNVTDGRLNFGNGVSAQIYLNGTAVRANDSSGIRLNALTNRTVSVRGDLVGTASGAGTTNASGVLILDAL